MLSCAPHVVAFSIHYINGMVIEVSIWAFSEV